MPTELYCSTRGCWREPGHSGFHGRNGPGVPLTCECLIPREGVNDECLRCRRVIAELVMKRREERR